ncbi:hypothetical protein V1477_001173 [Vespula maculifrons]|uniref:Uncharacterized protein n=1 Tax=Vespula maculifrons TaxID=7453 RepID=A0ABD2D2M6_VESMC
MSSDGSEEKDFCLGSRGNANGRQMLKVRELRNRFYWGTRAKRKFAFFSTTIEYLLTLFALMDHERAPVLHELSHCLLAGKYYLSIVCFTTAFPASPHCRKKSRERETGKLDGGERRRSIVGPIDGDSMEILAR